MALLRGLLLGAAAGAAGTTALNTVTYLDMAVRGRPASSSPEQAVEKLAQKAGTEVPGEGETKENRTSGLGPLLGVAAGVGVGAALGAARSLGLRLTGPVGTVVATTLAMAGSSGPMVALGMTDPRSWPASSWAEDAVPHLAYGAVTHATLRALMPRRPRR